MNKRGSYPRNISIIAAVFIFLILFLAFVNLYISIQFRNEYITFDRNKITSIATLCSSYLNRYDDHSELYSLFKNLTSAFNVEHLIVSDTLANKIFDSRLLPLELRRQGIKVDYTKDFIKLPRPNEVIQNGNKFVYLTPDSSLYLYTSLPLTYSVVFDRFFRWHILYITISLLFIGFLGVFLFRNLFLPMRYVANLAKVFGIEMKKEDFVSETFNEMFKKMKSKEETLIEFSSYIAHEFRNSIGAIIGLVRLVEKGKKPASAIIKECRTMEELISRLLDYSKPLKPLLSPVDVAQLIDDAVMKTSMPERIQLEKKIAKGMPQINVDYDLLLLAIINLLKNGSEAIQGKGIIEICANYNSDFLFISIADSGPGIDEKDLDKIFSPFFSKKETGLGLGLAYVKRIMEIHNGRVDVETKKEEGSKFVLKLPLTE